MISRSVAQIATASIRTRTSARAGTGTGLLRRKSSSGPPRTQAFISAGTGRSGDVLTPAGPYIGLILCFGAVYCTCAPLAATGLGPKFLCAAQLARGFLGSGKQLL